MSDPIRPVVEGEASVRLIAAEPLPGTPEGGDVQVVAAGWRLALREFRSNRLAVLGAGILLFFVVFCFLGPLVYQTNQTDFNPLATNLPPGPGHPLGTDEHGFDELGRIMAGGQTALEIGFLSAVLATVIGTLWVRLPVWQGGSSMGC